MKPLPLWMLVVAALALGLAPFSPEPHLVEKLRMLVNGDLRRPLDIFDLLMHGALPVYVLWRLLGLALKGQAPP
jgi:hypothetical protein